MSIKDIYSENEPSGGGLFLKLKDGDSFRVRFLGLPAVYESTFTDKDTQKKSVSTKYAWPVYNFDAEATQVLQGGATIYNALNSLIQNDDWGDPSEYDVTVGRTGSGLNDTKYSVTPLRKSLDLPKEMEDIDVVAITQKSDYNQNVHLLGQMFTPLEEDTVLEDIEEGGISLDDIPF